MEASEPKRVNSDYILYGVNSLRLGSLQVFKTNKSKLIELKIILVLNHKYKPQKI